MGEHERGYQIILGFGQEYSPATDGIGNQPKRDHASDCGESALSSNQRAQNGQKGEVLCLGLLADAIHTGITLWPFPDLLSLCAA